jgi:hypothetical protein
MNYQLSRNAVTWIKDFVDEVFNLPIDVEPCQPPGRNINFYHLSPGFCGERPGQKCYEVIRTKKAQEMLRATTNEHYQRNMGYSFVVLETKPTGRIHLCLRVSWDLDDLISEHHDHDHLDQFDKIVPSHLRQEMKKMARHEGNFIVVSNLTTVRPLKAAKKTDEIRRTI